MKLETVSGGAQASAPPGSAQAQLERIRAALSGSSEQPPRPLARVELPRHRDGHLLEYHLAEFRPAAVLLPLILHEDRLNLLLTRRSDALRSHGGQVSFPGGRRDPQDPSAAWTALREAQEEIGLDPQDVELLGFLDDFPTNSRYLVTPVVGLVRGRPSLTPAPAEVAEVFEMPIGIALDMASYRRQSVERGDYRFSFHELDFAPQRVWGVTAGILDEFRRTVMGE